MMESDMGSGRFQSSAYGEDFSCPTPEKKLGLQKADSCGDVLDISLTSGSATSDLSPRAGSASSSSLSPPSESESDPEFFSIRRVTQEQDEMTEFGSTEATVQGGGLEKRREDMYRNLHEKVRNYETELEFAYKVIMTSQEEISRLRSELQETPPTSTGVSNSLCAQFEATFLEDGTKASELKNTVARLEESLQDSDQSNAVLTEELRRTNERLQTCENQLSELEDKLKYKTYKVNHEMQQKIDSAIEVVRCLETELGSERWAVSELQARVDASANDVTKRNEEIQALNIALSTAHRNFSSERSALQSKLDEAESRVKLLEDQVGQSILEKMEVMDTLEAEEKQFQADINQLKTELSRRQEQVDVMNKSLDASKLKYDMLMSEKDLLTAKVDKIEACVTALEAERSQLLGKLEDEERTENELRAEVGKLEKEIAMHKDVIFDRAEQKREAIRQLCFSLDYYRSEYHQLCRAFSGLKMHSLR